MPWRSYLHITRPVNLLIMALMLLLVRYAVFFPVFRQNGLEGLMPGWQFLLLIMAAILIGAGGYVINDVLDIEIDSINKPDKQIIGKKISEVKGNSLHFNLTAAGILFGLAFSYLSGNIVLGVIFVIIPTALFYYSYKYKYLPATGNLVVALLAAAVVLIYWLFEFYYLKGKPEIFIEASLIFPQINRFIFAFALFAFLTTLTREIIKDMQDVKGDARFGCRTLPVLLGLNKVRYLVIALEAVIVACLVWFQIILFNSTYQVMSFSLFITQFILFLTIYKTIKAKNNNDYSRLSFLLKLVMITGMLSLIATWAGNF